jgi:hypothetical protein
MNRVYARGYWLRWFHGLITNRHVLLRYLVLKRSPFELKRVVMFRPICPGAEAVRGWRALNRPMVCTVGMVAPGARFLRLKERVSQVHARRVRIVELETTSLKRETSRRPNFFIFRPIEVPKEPRQGFWDAGKPLEQSVCQFEHCKTCF